MRTMNKDLTYHEWERALAEPAQKVSDWFENTLHNHFDTWADRKGGSVRRDPPLSNRSTPDFLIEDGKGRACYVEAKALFGSRKKSDYFEWRVDLSDLQHHGSGGIAHYRIDGEMTQDLSEMEKESIGAWIRGLDPSATLEEPWPYHKRTFPCGGANCEINVEFLNSEDSLIWGISKSGPKWRHRLEEKVSEALKDPKTGHDKYTCEALSGTPLVLAVLDVSSTHIVDLEGELYGNRFISIDAEGRKVGDGNTGTGIWRNETGIRGNRTHIAGIWYWDGLPHIGDTRERPVLATNPYNTNLRLPDSLRTFKRTEWQPTDQGTVVADRTDGGYSFDENSMRTVAKDYVDECRRGLGVV